MVDSEPPEVTRLRREPPRFRRVEVRRVEPLSPRLVRITLTGPELDGLIIAEPAASVRLLVPGPGAELVMPEWKGNEFLLPDGRRAVIRTFTPRHFDPSVLELDIDAVIHGDGPASTWAAAAGAGAVAAVSGPGRGYTIDPDASSFFLAGDETAIPAISQLLEAIPPSILVQVHIEIGAPDARLALPVHPRTSVAWHDLPAGAPPGAALVAAVRDADIARDGRVWVAGEAAAVQRIRRHLFDERAFVRAQTTVRGYWKHGRVGDADE